MRVSWVVLVLLVVGLAGCVDEPVPAPSAPTDQKIGQTLAPDDPLSAYTWNGTNLIYDELEPPLLQVGTAWTYETSGIWDLTPSVTVIVAEAGPEGYLFAAGAQDQLTEAAVWWRDYLGPRGSDLNLQGVEPLLDWPLHDGKVWQTHGVSVTAVAELVETPDGTHAGYRIAGDDGERFFEMVFVPAIGYLTEYAYGASNGAVYESLRLTEVGSATEAHWFDEGGHFSVGTYPSPIDGAPNLTASSMAVPEGYDELVLVGLGDAPGEAGVQSLAGGSAWGFTGDGPQWKTGRIAATPGEWLLTANTGMGGWAYLEGVPVTWTTYTL